MINIRLVGHHYEHDVFELVRVFFPGMPINIIREQRGSFHGLFLESIYDEKSQMATALLTESKEEIARSEISMGQFTCLKLLKNPEVKMIKSAIYDALSAYTGKVLPWGIMTGIRPVKVAHSMIEKGINHEDGIKCLTELFRISEKNAGMMYDIADRQSKYLVFDEKSFSLYVNIPFCPSRCIYCSFPTVIYERYKDTVSEYVDKLIEEIQLTKDLMEGKSLSTVYIGGGTPSSIPVRELQRIIQKIKEVFGEPKTGEFTVECGRADTITTPLIRMLVENGVNRISINPQSLVDDTLERIGRKHTEKEVFEAYNLSRRLGMQIINMDLIIGLPGENQEDVKNTLKKLEKMDPENLTIHTLAIKKGSDLNRKSDIILEDSDMVRNMLDITQEYAEDADYYPYYLYRQKNILGNFENIGYSKYGFECIYNIISMEEAQTIVGIGMGAVSKFYFPDEDRIERIANFKSIEEYINRFYEQIRRKESVLEE